MRTCILALVVVGLISIAAQAQDVNHYVVVGAFGVKENAARLANAAAKAQLNARVEFNKEKKLFYVYVIESAKSEEVYTYVMKVRVETPFKDAWVYHGTLGNRPIVRATPPPVIRQEVKVEEKPAIQEAAPAIVAATSTTTAATTPPPATTTTTNAPVEPPVIIPVVKEDPVPAKPPGKPFFFKLVSEQTGNPVEGEVQVLESAKASEYIAFASNEIVYLPAPKNSSGTYQLKTFAPGYKASTRALSYSDPANSAASKGSQDEFVIAIPLIRVKSGDYIEFSKVRFIANSVILQPESRQELAGLAGLMKENQSYKVVIHGHCNGTESRDVTLLGTSTDLFATNSGNVREHADAKRFTALRAETVKAFLVQEGVDESRIGTKGEGGKLYLYPVNSSLSARNDRVEIEVKKGR